MRIAFAATVALCLIWTKPVQAWNRPGHMVSGAIAYSELKSKNPEALAKVIKILKEHPHHDLWLPVINLQKGEDRNLYRFMNTARWPDDVRDDDQFHGDAKKPWHYINFPFKPEGQPESVKTRPPAPVNILVAFDEQQGLARDSSLADEDRAEALSWVFHLMGDVHQPLHTAALFTADFPKGDLGGNLFFIRKKPSQKTTLKLHAYWDGLILTSDSFKSVKKTAQKLREDFPRSSLTELSTVGFDKWADESFELAKKVAYRNGQLIGSRDEDFGEPLPSDYEDEVRPIAHRRVALAGYRLADLLEEWFK